MITVADQLPRLGKGFPLPLGAWDRLRIFIVALSGPLIYFFYLFSTIRGRRLLMMMMHLEIKSRVMTEKIYAVVCSSVGSLSAWFARRPEIDPSFVKHFPPRCLNTGKMPL